MSETPNAEKANGGVSSISFQRSMRKARDYATSRPGVALGAIAAIAIGAGLMLGRR